MNSLRMFPKLRGLRLKMSLEAALGCLICGCAAGLIAGICLALYAKFVFMPGLVTIMARVVTGCALAGACYALVRKIPAAAAVAAAADALGFKQRFITALEIAGTAAADSPIGRLVIDDAKKQTEAVNFTKLYKIKPPKKPLAVLAVALAGVVTVYFSPGPNADGLRRASELHGIVAEEAERITEAAKKEAEALTAKDADELATKIDEMVKELKKSSTEAEAMRTIRNTQEELKRLANNSVSRDLKELGERLAVNEKTRELGESLQRADTEAIEKNMEALAELLQTGDKSELDELAAQMRELAESIGDNPELAGMLNSLAAAAESGALGDLSERLSSVASGLMQAAANNSELRDAIESLNNALSQSSGRLGGGRQGSGGGQDSGEEQSSDGGQGSGEEQSSGGGQGSGEEQSAGGGQGSGEGQGSGSGGGQGSGEGQGYGSGQGSVSGSGQGRGEGHIENENIYSRNAEGMRDSELTLSGEETESGSTTKNNVAGIGSSDGAVPYTEVFGAYRDEALRTLDDAGLPAGMRELVKEYFLSLE